MIVTREEPHQRTGRFYFVCMGLKFHEGSFGEDVSSIRFWFVGYVRGGEGLPFDCAARSAQGDWFLRNEGGTNTGLYEGFEFFVGLPFLGGNAGLEGLEGAWFRDARKGRE